jgi:predicted transcriptional regulator YdeE
MEIILRTGFTVAGFKITTSNKEAMDKQTIAQAWNMFF